MPHDNKTSGKDATKSIEEAIRDIDRHLAGGGIEALFACPPLDRTHLSRVLVGSVDGQPVLFPFFRSRLTIGRAPDNDIRLTGSCVSRHHALIQTDDDITRITDWGSKNGVLVNSRAISGHFLRHGDTIAIGDVYFRYEERAGSRRKT